MRARSDRAILTAYWLVCGYGLKASRALITLLLAIAVGSLGLWAWGFTPDPPYTRALLYSIESTSSLFRVPNATGLDITYMANVSRSLCGSSAPCSSDSRWGGC